MLYQYVPEKAEEIVDEILAFVNRTMPEASESEDSSTDDNDIRKTRLESFLELREALRRLPYKWCNADPFQLEWVDPIREQADDCFNFAVMGELNTTEKVRVPLELLDVVGIGLFSKEPILETERIQYMQRLLQELKSRVQLREEAKLDEYRYAPKDQGAKWRVRSSELYGKNDYIPHVSTNGCTLKCSHGEYYFTRQEGVLVLAFIVNYDRGNDYITEEEVLRYADEINVSLYPEMAKKSPRRYSCTEVRYLMKRRKDSFRACFEQHPVDKRSWRLKP